ncbi:hypothetical protein Bca4012_020397 [Brassica carinata]
MSSVARAAQRGEIRSKPKLDFAMLVAAAAPPDKRVTLDLSGDNSSTLTLRFRPRRRPEELEPETPRERLGGRISRPS